MENSNSSNHSGPSINEEFTPDSIGNSCNVCQPRFPYKSGQNYPVESFSTPPKPEMMRSEGSVLGSFHHVFAKISPKTSDEEKLGLRSGFISSCFCKSFSSPKPQMRRSWGSVLGSFHHVFAKVPPKISDEEKRSGFISSCFCKSSPQNLG